MIAKDSFIILQSGTELTGALCRVGLKSREVSYLHHVTCADLTPQTVASGLRSLLDGLAAAGLKRPDDVRVCLSAGAALFRDWAFPFRSRAKVEQALSLMLETQFPFDADTHSHPVCRTGERPSGRRIQKRRTGNQRIPPKGRTGFMVGRFRSGGPLPPSRHR